MPTTSSLPRIPLHPVVQTVLYTANPTTFLERWQRACGDTFELETLMFGREVLISHPDDVRAIFTGDPDVLRAGEANEMLSPLLGNRSVLLLDGPEHLRQRKLLMPPFHGERLQRYGEAMRKAAERAARSFPSSEAFSLHPLMQRLTLEVIVETVFGEKGRSGEELAEALQALLEKISSGLTPIFTLPPFRRQAFGLSPWASIQRALARTDRMIYDRIARRRSGEQPPGDDVLSLLLEVRDEQGNPMTDIELRDELMTLLVAGHETTATMLCWAAEQLVSQPAALARLEQEVRGARGDLGQIAKLPYLDAVIKEVLRLRPVIPAVGRKLSAPMKLRDRWFPEGTVLVPLAYLAQRNPTYYPEPESFRPERFVDAKPDLYTWFPFGGGARRCLGMAFALYEMKIVLATLVERASFRRAGDEAERIALRTFTFAPSKGGRVIATRAVAPARVG